METSSASCHQQGPEGLQLLPARSTLASFGLMQMGNSWKTEPLAVLDTWRTWLTLELKMLSLGLWTFGSDIITVLQAFREKQAGEEQSRK